MKPITTDEQRISAFGALSLSNLRVMHLPASDGSTETMMSIPLEHVQWVQLRRANPWALLILAGLLLLGGVSAQFAAENTFGLIVGVVLGLILVGAYFASLEVRVNVGAGNGVMSVRVQGSKKEREDALNFIQALEQQALLARMRMLPRAA